MPSRGRRRWRLAGKVPELVLDEFQGVAVLGQGRHRLGVGAVRRHRHGDHLDAERLGDAEMAVVAGNGAEPLDGFVAAPRRASKRPEIETARNGIVHKREA